MPSCPPSSRSRLRPAAAGTEQGRCEGYGSAWGLLLGSGNGNAVQHQVNDAFGVAEPRLAQDRVSKREGDRPQRAGCGTRLQPQAIGVRLEQRSQRGVELLIVSLLAPAEIVMVFGRSAVQ